jgi:PAS domain S-box-containing protein
MNWIDIVWPMLAAASLMLGLIHLLTWFKQGKQTAHLMFALAAISVAAIGIFELLMMRAPTPERYAVLVRWAHVPFAFVIIGAVGFVRLHLHAGRLWLGVLICVARLASLLPNFLTGVNLNFLQITSLSRITVWGGDSIAVPIGVPNPWMPFGQLTIVALVAFLIDAIVSGMRHGDAERRRKIILICGSMAMFAVLSATWTLAVVGGKLRAPLMINPAFLCVLLVMSYELSGDILRAAQLATRLSVSEARLRESEQRMETAVTAADIGLWNWNVASGEFWLSETGAQLHGFAPGEKIDREAFVERIHPDDRENLRVALAHAARESGEYRCEYRVVDRQGRTHWIVARGQADSAENGAPLRLHGVIVDITERKEGEEHFRMVVETSPTPMLMVDGAGLITLVNRQAEVVFGYAREELVGMRVEALVPRRLRGRHAELRAGYAANATSRAMGATQALFAQRKDGTEIPVEIALSPVHSEQGLFVLASIADKRIDRELATQRDELAHLSRVVLLAELSGSLAHELNQPLTAILSNAQAATRFLAHSPPNLDEVRESLIQIVENDKRAGEVIRRLRSMLRKEPADHRRLDMNDVVLDVLRIIRSDLLNRNVEIILDLDPNLPAIEGDSVQLQQVLLNLAMNGTDAMADVVNGRELIVRTRPTETGVDVSVADVGAGISPDDLERIFAPFVTTKTSGMGLGLAVCTSIIQSHHGKIWATNNASRGATVHFALPGAEGTGRS